LQDKKVEGLKIKSDGNRLLIPLRDTQGTIHSLQFIDPIGNKLFLPDGAIKGHYFGIGKPNGTLVVCEGYATGVSIHESTGHGVAVAFNAGNLQSAARALRTKYPDIKIIVAGDNDQFTEGNPGVAKAKEAAKAVKGLIAVPEFKNIESKPTDFNDLYLLEGADEVNKQISQGMHDHTKGAVIICASSVKPEPITWLWPDRIALGKLTLIAGDPGLGKSLLSIEFAKHVSTGMPWPVDNTQCPCGDVVLLSAEDDMADTIRPRLDAVGADVNRVFFIKSIRDIGSDGELINRSFSLKRDLEAMREVLSKLPECRLIVIDPISAYLDGSDTHNNADIRGLLAPLAELASSQKVAIVAITHLNKGGQSNAMYRATGSLAFVAAARAVFIVARDNDDPDRRLILPIKNNLGPDNSGFAYRVVQAANNAPVIEWEPDLVTISADEALTPLPDDLRTERDDAVVWLKDALNEGPAKVTELIKNAKACGISERTLKRAKKDLGVESYKREFDGNWSWRLPEVGQACYSPVAPFDET